MGDMNIPSPRLRFIIRDVCDGVDADGDDQWVSTKVLQQVVETTDDVGEYVFVWRDVPLQTDPE